MNAHIHFDNGSRRCGLFPSRTLSAADARLSSATMDRSVDLLWARAPVSLFAAVVPKADGKHAAKWRRSRPAMIQDVSSNPTSFVGLNVGPESRVLQKAVFFQELTIELWKPLAPPATFG